jgi:hypothetical protein
MMWTTQKETDTMLGMADRKKNRNKGGRARQRGEVRLINAEVDPRLDDAVEEFMIRDRRSKKVVITMALEEFLQKHGLWPPK